MELLKELTEASGAPGFEDEVRAIVRRELDGLVDEVEVDRLGNVRAVRRPTRRADGEPLRVMLAGHMDEIGFVVRHVDDDGFLRLNPLGGFDPKTLIAKRVTVRTAEGDLVGVTGTKPIHVMTDEEKKEMPEVEDIFVDIGLPADEVSERVAVGDPVTLRQSFQPFGDLVSGKSMDNRVAVWTLLRTLERLREVDHGVEVHAVFTTQEEVGLRGATTSAYGVDPDVGVAVDVTLACDMPGVKEPDHITALGEGTAIKVCDGRSISDPRIVRRMRELADEREIPHQTEILPKGGTDAGGIQRTRAGVPVVTLSVPTRYVHSVVEAIHPDDLRATVDLLAAYLETLGPHDLDRS